MTRTSPIDGLTRRVSAKPLQAAKFVGVLLAIVLGVAGFLRLLSAEALLEGPLLGDGQFLALIGIPLVSLLLVSLVVLESLHSAVRAVRSEASFGEQIDGRVGYLLLRWAEAGVAVLGVLLIAAVVPTLVTPDTPAPAGVGIMLLLFAVGLAILVMSFIRSAVELFSARSPDRSANVA